MKRMIALLIVLCAAVGFLTAAWQTVDALQDDVVTTVTHRYGDLQRAQGVQIRTQTTCGYYMWWDCTHTIGQEGETESQFHFSQDGHHIWEQEHFCQEFSLGGIGGMGMSSNAGLDFPQNDFGQLIAQVAQNTPAAESHEETLLLEDYLDTYPLDYWIDLRTQRYVLDESYSIHNLFFGEEPDESMQYVKDNYDQWSSLFRFPILPGDTITITVGKGVDGRVLDLNISGCEANIKFPYVVADEGLYFYPLFQDTQGNAIKTGEYRYGNGLYYIPFRPLENVQGTPLQPATLDFEGLKLVFPLDADFQLLAMEETADGTGLHLLTQEASGYTYHLFDLGSRNILQSVSIPIAQADWTFYPEQELLYLAAEEEIALVRMGQEAQIEFIAPWPAEIERHFPTHVAYRDGVLYGVMEGWYESHTGVTLMICDRDGLAYLGLYSNNLDSPGYDSAWFNLEEFEVILP